MTIDMIPISSPKMETIFSSWQGEFVREEKLNEGIPNHCEYATMVLSRGAARASSMNFSPTSKAKPSHEFQDT